MFKHAKIIDEIAIKQNSVQSLMKRRPMRISVIQCCLNVLKGDLQTHSKSNNKRRTKFTIKTHDLESNVKKTTSAHRCSNKQSKFEDNPCSKHLEIHVKSATTARKHVEFNEKQSLRRVALGIVAPFAVQPGLWQGSSGPLFGWGIRHTHPELATLARHTTYG